MKRKKVNELNDPVRDARFEDIKKQLMDFSDEYGAFFVCMILIPTDVEKISEWRLIFGEELSFLAGHGPKEHLLKELTERLKDIDDQCEFKKWEDRIN